jgi:putative ABC transport system permease protein
MIRRVLDILWTALVWLWCWLARNGQNIVTAFVQIWAHKGRSLLTTLGIIIAVTSIITVVSFVEGFGKYVTGMLQGYGTSFIIVHPDIPWEGHRPGQRRIIMNLADVEAVRTECEAVKRMSPLVFRSETVTYGGATAKEIMIRAVGEHYQAIRNYYVDVGRFFGPIDVQDNAYVCVLGRSLLKMLECDESIVGDCVYVSDRRFRVIGLLASKGSFLEEDQDQTIMIPYTTGLTMYPEEKDRIIFLAEATAEDKIDAAAAQITRVLRQRHDLAPGERNDFNLERQDQMIGQLNQVRMIATAILAGIVSISLVVGGIGIMNVMLVSVTERTREIGLRKSVGGRRRDILLQFLTEAVVLSTVGGVIGVLLGCVIARIAALHPKMVPLELPMWSIALALGFSAGAGVIFGVIPAFKAAVIHPIDALRHE